MLTLRGGRLQGRLRDDTGLGLVEVLIGAFLAFFAISALAQMLTSAIGSVGTSEHRLRATQIAAETIENVQSLEWDDVGFYTSDSYVAPPFDGVADWEEVVLGSAPPASAPANRPVPDRTVTRDGLDYQVHTDIVEDVGTAHRRRIRAVVTWTFGGSTRSVTASSFVAAPGTSAQPAFFYMLTATAGSDYYLIDDDNQLVSVAGLPGTIPLAAAVNRDNGAVTVSYTDGNGVDQAVALDPDPTGLAFADTILGGTFPHGPTEFRFTASLSGYPDDVQDVPVTFLYDEVRLDGTVTVGGLINGRLCVRTTTQRPFANHTVTFDVHGFQANDQAAVTNGVNTWLGETSTTTATGVRQEIDIRTSDTLLVVPTGLNTGNLALTFTLARTSALPVGPTVAIVNVPVRLATNPSGCV